MNSSYTIGCAVLGALEKRKSTIGAYIPGIIHGDGGPASVSLTTSGKTRTLTGTPALLVVGAGLGLIGFAVVTLTKKLVK